MPSFWLALLLVGCTPSTPQAQPKAQAQQSQKGKAKINAAKAAKIKAMKAKAAKMKAMKAKAAQGGGAAGGPAKRVGIAGPMLGQLVLTPQGEGDAMKTRAQLRMGWEGGTHTAFLGVTAGECVEAEPREVASGLTATWWTTCGWKEMSADFAILESGGIVLVQRAITRDGQQGEWVTVRRIPLAEGAELAKGEVAEPPAGQPAGEGADGDAPGGGPAEAPAAPAAPAPAPEGGPE